MNQWLPCALNYLRTRPLAGRRRLLQEEASPDFGAQRGTAGATVQSATMVTRQQRETRTLVVQTRSDTGGSSSTGADGTMPTWEIAVIAGGCLLVAVLLFFMFRYVAPKRSERPD